jgi:maltose/moltooligosaccharide transporter
LANLEHEFWIFRGAIRLWVATSEYESYLSLFGRGRVGDSFVVARRPDYWFDRSAHHRFDERQDVAQAMGKKETLFYGRSSAYQFGVGAHALFHTPLDGGFALMVVGWCGKRDDGTFQSIDNDQRTLGYSIQSFFVGLGQTLANTMPLILTAIGISTVVAEGSIDRIPDFVKYSFIIGAVAILVSIAVTVFTTNEEPPAEEEKAEGKKGLLYILQEVIVAFKEMPSAMRRLWWVKFFTWFGLPMMWQYLSLSIARHCFNAFESSDAGFADGVKWGNLGLAVFNVLCFAFALILPALSKRMHPRMIHALCLTAGGAAFISMKFLNDPYHYMIAMAAVGIAWASIMSMPYVMLSQSVPANRMGVYMGIFNMFIVIPQIISMVVVYFIYDPILLGDPANALMLAGFSLIAAAGASRIIR